MYTAAKYAHRVTVLWLVRDGDKNGNVALKLDSVTCLWDDPRTMGQKL